MTISEINYQRLYQRIGQFYDESSSLWEATWGEHMHHGYYGPQGNDRKDRYQAQVDLIEELLAWAQVEAADRILDVGCGIGGSTLYLAKKFQAQALGITLSPKQVARAQARAQAQDVSLIATETIQAQAGRGTGPQVGFQVANALQTPFPDNTFDMIWSLESGEHMPNKRQFLAECYRQLKPGGKFLMATWCHRPTDLPAGALTADEQRHLASIYRVYCLPYVIALPEYVAIATDLGFQNVRSADWSKAVEPFWRDVIISALNPFLWPKLLGAGTATLKGALSLGLMSSGFQQGLIRYGLICCTK
jgi:tocopherol O-methyltransferase